MLIKSQMFSRKMMDSGHKSVNTSVLISSCDIIKFKKLYSILSDTCSDTDGVEILLKADNEGYESILRKGPFKYKYLIYPKWNRRLSLHHFYNDLFKISSGKILWPLYEDIEEIDGDWANEFCNTRNIFKDNVYVINIYCKNFGRRISSGHAVSKEWADFCGFVSLFPNMDRWLCELSFKINRSILLRPDKLTIKIPRGHRVIPRKWRKKLFQPAIDKWSKKLRKHIK